MCTNLIRSSNFSFILVESNLTAEHLRAIGCAIRATPSQMLKTNIKCSTLRQWWRVDKRILRRASNWKCRKGTYSRCTAQPCWTQADMYWLRCRHKYADHTAAASIASLLLQQQQLLLQRMPHRLPNSVASLVRCAVANIKHGLL